MRLRLRLVFACNGLCTDNFTVQRRNVMFIVEMSQRELLGEHHFTSQRLVLLLMSFCMICNCDLFLFAMDCIGARGLVTIAV